MAKNVLHNTGASGAKVTCGGGTLRKVIVAELLSYFSGSRALEQSFEEFEARYIAGRIVVELEKAKHQQSH
jgi:hypothetical protein